MENSTEQPSLDPIYYDDEGHPRFALARGTAGRKVFVVSVPKAGTYLLGLYLEKLGLVSTGVHLSEQTLTDYRGRSIEEMVSLGARLNVPTPLDQSLPMISPGQFAVGHLAYSPETAALLADFSVIFTHREMRASLVSTMRFFENEGRGEEYGVEWKAIADRQARMAAFANLYFPTFLPYMGSVVPWIDAANVLKVRFETLVETERPIRAMAANAIADAVGTRIRRGEQASLLSACLGSRTKTWSGSRSRLADYWSDETEAVFDANGGSAFNAALGYRNSWADIVAEESLRDASNNRGPSQMLRGWTKSVRVARTSLEESGLSMFRSLARLIERGGTPLATVPPNATFPIPPWWERSFAEPTVQLALRDLCRPNDTVLDVGANAGALSLVMSRLVGPHGQVFAFEASPRIVDKTQHNLIVNGCANTQVFHKAVYRRSHEAVRIYAGSHLNDSIYRNETGDSGVEVETIALDDFCAHWGAHPSVVKMDIEGAEYDALLGFERSITADRPHLILEQTDDDTRCLEFLSRLGYVAFDLATYVALNDRLPTGLSNIIYVHRERLASTPFGHLAVESAGDLAADGSITLAPGRYVFDVDMQATGRDNEMFCGIETVNGEMLFRYHTYSQFMAASYSKWPIHLDRTMQVRPFYRFLNNTNDPTFKVNGVQISRIAGFGSAVG